LSVTFCCRLADAAFEMMEINMDADICSTDTCELG
jgi:hypothetical protein